MWYGLADWPEYISPETTMVKNALSKTQIDRLGDRLKKGSHTEDDLRLLEDYRLSFGDAYNDVIRIIRERGQFPTGRLAKSTFSIVEKLRRESIRLSQMQDIAGCRVVVEDINKQIRVVRLLKKRFPEAREINRGPIILPIRRMMRGMPGESWPSSGYRAVHIIAIISGKPIEIQVRSSLQHLWAELSERAADVLDPTIKYGGGPEKWRKLLASLSEWIAEHEMIERLDDMSRKSHHNDDAQNNQVAQAQKMKNEISDILRSIISQLDDLKGHKQ
jgi:ppGpp synthetase/RelA/SpoT-type nucleotidyltranferase